MSALLCCGHVFYTPYLSDDGIIYKWLDMLLASKDEKVGSSGSGGGWQAAGGERCSFLPVNVLICHCAAEAPVKRFPATCPFNPPTFHLTLCFVFSFISFFLFASFFLLHVDLSIGP